MHYALLTAGIEHEIEVEEVRPGTFVLHIDGRRLELDAHELSPGQLRLRFEGLSFVVELDGERAWVGDACLQGEVVDLRALALRRAKKAAEGAGGSVAITSPMAGKVAAVLVAEGQEVAEGDGLLVIEAMKMENELRAPRPGVVRNLTGKLGHAVDLGATLCRVE